MIKKYKFLIIGSEGATGRSVFNTLNKSFPNRIFRTDRSPPLNSYKKSLFFQLDLNDLQACKQIQDKYHFDTVVYLSGVWKGQTTDISNFMENFLPFNNFINTIAKATKHIIYFSSSLVRSDGDVSEALVTTMPKSSYAMAKVSSESLLIKFCRDNLIKYTIFRPFHIVSPYEKYNPGRSHVTTDFIFKIEKYGKSVELNRSGFSNIWIPFTWSYDIANAVKNSIGNAKAYNKIINIGSPYMQSLEQLEKIITHCIYFQEGDGKLNEFNLTPKKVNYFDRGNRILGEYATTSLYEMVDNFISFNNIKEHSKFDS